MITKQKPTDIASVKSLYKLVAVIFFALGFSLVIAKTGHAVYVPMTFYAETETHRTTACLKLTEHIYSQLASWKDIGGNATASEQAVKEVISAFNSKNITALVGLSDPANRKDPKSFNTQMDAYIHQFAEMEFFAIPQSYEFDGLAVFFAKIRYKQGSNFFSSLNFDRQNDGSFRFLPERPRHLTFEIVDDWFIPKRGITVSVPPYCSDQDIKRATHKISLVAAAGKRKVWRPSEFFLRGAALDAPGALNSLAERVKLTVNKINAALESGNVNKLIKHMTPEGGKRHKEWFDSVTQEDRDRYKVSTAGLQPFFVFDASPLIVVYTKSSAKRVEVMYFTANANHELLWTNSSHITGADRIFKKGPLYNAALEAKPFASLIIR